MKHTIRSLALILACVSTPSGCDKRRRRPIIRSVAVRGLIALCLLAVPLLAAEPERPQPKSATAEAQELRADDAAVMKQVVGLAGETVEPKRAARAGGAGFEWVKSKTHRLFVLCDAQGHITELRGNGPWLSNEALAEVAKLPELRLIYMDHNIPPPGSDVLQSKFDGTGFSAFRNGKLEWVLIGHTLTNEGARALASIPTLKSIHIEHANRVTGEGIRYFAGHKTLERFAWGCQIRWDEAAFFDTAASLPKVRELVFKDAIATYDGGLSRLRPVAGRLQKLELQKTLALPADLDRFRTDHPQAEVITILPEHFEVAATKLKGRMSPELKAWTEAELVRIKSSR